MKNFIFLLVSIVAIGTAVAQNPAILWQNTIGGSDTDFLQSFEPTPDGGFILGGGSTSNISGDKTENSNGGQDIWIVKVDASGIIEWQNTIGGSGEDYALTVKPTTDGGYIVLGASDSDISGDKTENSRGGLDYWILKLNSSGSIDWQRTYGGAQPDFEAFGGETADGGYIVGGYSDSDISGDKTDPSNGQRDFWILKLDVNGDIVWQNSIGGSLVDEVLMTKQTTDGGYIIGGFSNSPASGDKSENSNGLRDYWIVKLNPDGSVQWENTIGGSDQEFLRDITQTADGGYIAAGYSKSNISGDKTENSQGDYDYWVIKLDALGNLTWQNTIGGSGIDYPRDLIQLNDGSYMVAGWSNSGVSGDKTIPSNGGYDFWLVKLNTTGSIISQNSIGGSGDESGTYILEAGNGEFVMACSSDSNTSGDKSDDNEGLDDYWIFRTTIGILGVSENLFEQTFQVFPNPTTGLVTIKLNQDFTEVLVSITSTLGQVVASERFVNTDALEIALRGRPGIYFVTLTTPEGVSETIKILKK